MPRTKTRIRYQIEARGERYILLKWIDDGRQSHVEPLGVSYDTQDEAAAVARGDAAEEGVQPIIEYAE